MLSILALNALPKIGPIRVRRLLERFGDAESILKARKDELIRVDGIGEETATILTKWQDFADPVTELREATERGISILTPEDDHFPPALREAYDAPLLLYVWGKVEARDRHAIGIVGTRRCTIYGRHATKLVSFQLAHAGFTIVSGLARGVDTVAHEAALAAGGRTIAVLGSGLAQLFPAENLALAEKIAEGRGAVVSEFPLHTMPDKQTFPQRNRIVAAWSRAIVVTECARKSGSLITANLAGDYGRPVYAVPGPIDAESSAGCNQLIREGATLATSGEDILEDLGELPFARPAAMPAAQAATLPELPAEEAKVFSALGEGESGVDRLVESTGLAAPVVATSLMKLEMRKLVRALPGFRYVKR
ncbi:DNA-processing protein DprA [Luteolibacter sp. Populi]|uniref:DNA-processing protein DprA n=1 Tax=Luteolibacter sp. Populi TaxID=3230487 RepID=UPI0034669C1B